MTSATLASQPAPSASELESAFDDSSPPAYDQAVEDQHAFDGLYHKPTSLPAVDIRWSDVSGTHAERHGLGSLRALVATVVPFTMLVLRILGSLVILLVRLAGLSLSQLLGMIQRTLANLDAADSSTVSRCRYASMNDNRNASDNISSPSSACSAPPPFSNRHQRLDAASALDQSSSLQQYLRSRSPTGVHIHHYHHHHPSINLTSAGRRKSTNSPGLPLDASQSHDATFVHASDPDHSPAEQPAQSDSDDSDGSTTSTVLAFPGIDEYEEPEDDFARKLARMALYAQAELDMRLACGEISEEGTMDAVAFDSDESDTDSARNGTQDPKADAPQLASITSTDPATPLAISPITVSLNADGSTHPVRRQSSSTCASAPDAQTQFPNWSQPLDQILAPNTAPHPADTRRGGAPAPILLHPQPSSSSSGALSPGFAPSSEGTAPSEPDSMALTESRSQCSSNTTRQVRLREPDWRPYVETHARARARVQLDTLLQAARSAPQGRRASWAHGTQDMSRKAMCQNMHLQALSAHARHTDVHAQMHAQAHQAASHTVTREGPAQQPSWMAGSSSASSLPTVTDEEGLPDLWFERFFPGRAASGNEWDWRKRRGSAPHVSDAVLEKVAKMLFDASPSPSQSMLAPPHARHAHPRRRSTSSHIVSQANVASALMAAKTAGLASRPRTASAPQSEALRANFTPPQGAATQTYDDESPVRPPPPSISSRRHERKHSRRHSRYSQKARAL